MSRFARLALVLLCILSATSWVSGQQIHPGISGAALEDLLRRDFSPASPLSYTDAKQAMFSRVDNRGGRVRLLYTGDAITTTTVPNPNFVNAEHIWPQSRFGNNAAGKKSDLHHLFPTHSRVNSTRGNNPFGEIDDAQTQKWWNGPTFIRGVPGAAIDSYSESTNNRFEPREDDKGDVARAMLYFRTIYAKRGIPLSFFDSQRKTLLEWHAQDPASGDERLRNDRVALVQGNRNPFIDDPTLALRVFSPNAPAGGQPPVRSAVAARSAAGGVPAAVQLTNGDEIDVMTWNLKFFYDADTSDNVSELALEQSADSDAEFAQRLERAAVVIRNAGLPEIVALQEVENQKVVQRLADALNANHGANYKVGFVQGKDSYTEQDVAFLYEDRGLSVEFQRIPTAGFSNSNLYKMPSKHCVMAITHTLAAGQTKQLLLVNCHFVAGGQASSEAQRKKQSRVVNRFVANSIAARPTCGVIVLGDMNANIRHAATTAQDSMGVLRGMSTSSAADDLLDLHGELAPANRKTHVSGKELDRIFLSGSLLDEEGLVFSQVTVRRDLVQNESDHFPLIATFIYRQPVTP